MSKHRNRKPAGTGSGAETNPGSFRPASYWEDPDPLSAILRNVRGANRRQMIIDYWNAGKIEKLDPGILVDKLDPEARRRLGAIHPTFLGGEFLPDLLPTEVEIARIELASTTADVISIRARREPGDELIHYRIVDEYETEYQISPESSAEPLTQAELVRLIDTADEGEPPSCGPSLRYNRILFDCEGEPEALREFTTVSSTIYPSLFDHYQAFYEQWYREERRKIEEEDDDDESGEPGEPGDDRVDA